MGEITVRENRSSILECTVQRLDSDNIGHMTQSKDKQTNEKQQSNKKNKGGGGSNTHNTRTIAQNR